MKLDERIVEFSISKRDVIPKLHTVALRVLVTSTFSTSSEQDFSILKLIVNKLRNILKEDAMKSIGRLRSRSDEE